MGKPCRMQGCAARSWKIRRLMGDGSLCYDVEIAGGGGRWRNGEWVEYTLYVACETERLADRLLAALEASGGSEESDAETKTY